MSVSGPAMDKRVIFDLWLNVTRCWPLGLSAVMVGFKEVAVAGRRLSRIEIEEQGRVVIDDRLWRLVRICQDVRSGLIAKGLNGRS